MSTVRIVAASFAALLATGAAHAQYRCDCTSVVDTCSAEVVARGSWLEITTDRPQCARVDYFVDGQPFVSVVVDGEDREDWLARTASPRILVQSCQVCRDNGPGADAVGPAAARPSPPADGAGGAGETLQPLIAVAPEFPSAAQARGLAGHVDVEFTVNAVGNVENARVIAAEPRGVFDGAALAAVARRRYPAEAERAPVMLTERIAFRPDAGARASGAAARTPAGPRNACVRESGVFNYGDMVDVGLINTCGEPLLVFGCAQGTGRNVDRWICNDSEQRGSVLVGAGDARLGSRYAADNAAGIRTFTYTDSFSVTRAPNSEYWWVACTERDEECRAAARQWTRSVSGQSARVDPQDRSAIPVARSY
jgi:TonB family protein